MLRVMQSVVLLLCASMCAAADPPITLHPQNPHYFVWRGKPTVLITSGEHYGALLNREFDYAPYLKELHAHGLNHTRTFSGTYREIPGSFGITDNTIAPKSGQYVCPWARSNQPGESDGGSKFDLTQWDPGYFSRLKDFLSQAGRLGVVVEMNLFCPLYEDNLWQVSPMNARNNVNGIGNCPRTEVFALKHDDLTGVQIALTRKIVEELREFDNLFYEICNEPYFGGVTRDWQHRIVDTIVETEREFPHHHLISMNIANGRQKIEKPHPAVSIFNFHYCVPPDAVTMNYALGKVIGENETGFRGKDDLLYRTEAWDFLLAGGGLYNNLDYSFSTMHPDGSLRDYRSPGGGSRELRAQLGVLMRFLEGFEFIRLQPVPTAIRRVSDGLTAMALAETGKAYAVYLHTALPEKPKNLRDHLRALGTAELVLDVPAGSYKLTWMDPVSGNMLVSNEVSSGGELNLRTPPFENDIALRIIRN